MTYIRSMLHRHLTDPSRSIIPRPVLALVAALFTVALVAGCSGGDGEDSADTTVPTTAPTITTPAVTTPEPPFTTVEEAINYERPVVLTHAGGENRHPHSTMFAYVASVEDGVDILDFDVRLTKDGELVIFHDDTVDRTTDATGRVDEMTWAELHALDAAYWFTEDCSACKDQPEEAYIYRGIRTGEKEPPEGYTAEDFAPTRLVDVIERYPDWVLNIEMKGSYPDDVPLAEKLADVLTKADKLDSSIVTAFDDALADKFHELAPQVSITPGLQAMTMYVLANEKLPEGRVIVQIPPEYEGIDLLKPDLIERAHADGLVLWIWPNEREWENTEGYMKLLGMGVDGLNAANPIEAVEAVRSFVGD